jgi:hypothetical protein
MRQLSAGNAVTTAQGVESAPHSTTGWDEVQGSARLQPFVVAALRSAAVLAFFALATIVIFWTSITHLHSALIGPPEDNMNDLWNTWYAAAGHRHGHFFATRILRFPEGTSLLYQSFAYPQLFFAVGLSRLFGADLNTLVALQNITLLSSFPLAGLGAFCLARHLVRSSVGGLVGGFVFAFNPSHVAHALHHAGVSSIEFLPFFVLGYLLALERRSVLWLGSAAVFYALSALSCWYYLFYGAYFLGLHLLYERIRDGAWPRGWHLLAPAVCIVATGAMLAPILLPMLLAAGPSVYQPGGNIFVADLLGFAAFPPEHLLAGLSRGLYARFTGLPWESTVYLGLINLALLVWYALRNGVARNSLIFYVIFGMAAFSVLACGESLHVAGAVTNLYLPDVALDRLPFFANVRTPSRAIVFVYLFLSIGVACAVSARRLESRFASRISLIAICALIAIDFYPARLAATPVACRQGLKVLDADPERGFGVLNLPFGYASQDSYMLEQLCHRRPIVDGVISREMGTSLLNRLSVTDLSRQRRQFLQARVKYLLLHKPANGLYHWNRELPPIAQFRKFYSVVYDGPDMMVLRTY